MESKQKSSHQSPYPYTRYNSFLAQNMEYYNQCGINVLQGRRIRACFHGWVILCNRPDNVLWSLWNPLTSKFIRLPPLICKDGGPYNQCCLSSPPSDQGSVFLLLTEEIPTIVFCRLDCKRKRLKWTTMSYAKQIRNLSGVDCLLTCPTCCNGKVYAITNDYYYMFVIEIDIVVRGKEVVISLVPYVTTPSSILGYYRFPSCTGFDTFYSFLKGSGTELFYIEVCCKDETRVHDVYLFKLDMISMAWEEMMDLKDAIFFLEFGINYSHSLFYKSMVVPKTGGYVHALGEMDKIIYSFHVKDRTMSLSSMPCILREDHVLVWAMLECRLQVDDIEYKQEEGHKDTNIAIRPYNCDEIELDNKSESHLLNIPSHILEMIMEYCVGLEYLKFRATCKRCKLAAPWVQWSDTRTLTRLQMYSLFSPWLLVLDNNRGIITLVDPICGDKYFINTPQKLSRGYQICCSKYGWLLMCKVGVEFHGLQLLFFNPFTSNIRNLPTIPYCVESLCFSAPPTSPDCMVVGFTSRGLWNVYILFVYKEPIWRTYGFDFGTNDPYSFHLPSFSRQDIYTLCKNNENVQVFSDLRAEDYSCKVVVDKAPRSCCGSWREYFLLKCDQHLLLVIVGELRKSIEVFKLNDSTKEWEKIDCLGNHMIYISNTSCICLEAKLPEMGNKIYFPTSLRNNKDPKIMFYSLKTCKYHTFDHDKNIQESYRVDIFNTKDYCYPHTWIEPSWS